VADARADRLPPRVDALTRAPENVAA
jgi:hypothetical protein